jgi:hypothetical protein
MASKMTEFNKSKVSYAYDFFDVSSFFTIFVDYK